VQDVEKLFTLLNKYLVLGRNGTNTVSNVHLVTKLSTVPPCETRMVRKTIPRLQNVLRQNPIENRATSGFSGQKSGTGIILSILQSFLHCEKAKCVNN